LREEHSTSAWLVRAIHVTAGLTPAQVIVPGASQRYLETHLDQPLRLDDVAHLVRLSPN